MGAIVELEEDVEGASAESVWNDYEMIVRAARLHKLGEPLKIEMVELPEPREGEVLVDLAFAGVNPIDRYTAEGSVAPEGPLPRTLGFDAAGVLDGRPVVVHGEGLGTARDEVWAQLAVRGRLVVYGTSAGPEVTFNLRQLYRKRISLLGYGGTALTREERREGTQRALEALARHELKLPIHDRLALEQVNEAFERLAARTVRGKLLLDLNGP